MTILRAFCLVVSLVGFAGSGFADQTDPRLNGLFGQLEAASGPAESVPIEQEIWAIWLVAPDALAQSLIDSGIDAMHRGDLGAAFDEVVAREVMLEHHERRRTPPEDPKGRPAGRVSSPLGASRTLDDGVASLSHPLLPSGPETRSQWATISEIWYGRATVHYFLNNLRQSLDDIAATLRLEPRHFGALSGRGLVYIKLGDLEQALSAFEEALEVDPQMTGARANIDAIRKILGQREI